MRLVERRDARGHGRSYAPAVRFTTDEGREVEFTASLGTNPATYGVGDKVKVRYDSQNPSAADVDSATSRWFGVVVLLIIGVVFSVFGARMLLPEKRRVSSSAQTT